MKKIRIFIGSSIDELAQERKDLVAFLSALNNKYIDRGVYIEPYICEEMRCMMLTEGSQSVHNKYIEDESDICIFMFFEKAGEFTVEELERAKRTLDNLNRPNVYIFFKVVGNAPSENDEIKRTIDKIANEYKHYYKTFENADTVKLEILQMLAPMLGEGTALIIKDGKVMFDGLEINPNMLSVENVFAYRNNPDLKRLKSEIEELRKEIHDKVSSEDYAGLSSLSEKLKEKQKLYNDLEGDILSMLKNFTERIKRNEIATQKRMDALKHLEQGDIEGAKRIMNGEGIIAEAINRQSLREVSNNVLAAEKRSVIEDGIVYIDILKMDVTNPGRFDEIEAMYDSILPLCKNADRLDLMFEFSSFLYNQNKYEKAIKIAEKLRYYFSDPDEQVVKNALLNNLLALLDVSNPDKQIAEYKNAQLNNLLALLYFSTGRFAEAERLYTETLEIHRTLSAEIPGLWLPSVADTYNNLAVLHEKNKRFAEAEELYAKALEIRRKLSANNPGEYLPKVANTCNNLAILYDETGRFVEAEELFSEALDIYREQATENPGAYLSYVADTYNNLAELYDKTGRVVESEKLYTETLKIRRKQATENPGAYLPEVAKTCNNLANLYNKIGRFADAEILCNEALEIYRKLTEKNPEVYIANFAETCNRLASLFYDIGRIVEIEKLYTEVIEICRKLSAETPGAYPPDVATTCYNLAILYETTGKNDDAGRLFDEALSIAKQYPDNPDCRQIIEALI